MIIIAARITARPEKRGELTGLIGGLIKSVRQDRGCHSCNCYTDFTNQNSFLFYEEWASQKDIDEHFKTSHIQEFMKKMPQLIEGEPVIKLYQES